MGPGTRVLGALYFVGTVGFVAAGTFTSDATGKGGPAGEVTVTLTGPVQDPAVGAERWSQAEERRPELHVAIGDLGAPAGRCEAGVPPVVLVGTRGDQAALEDGDESTTAAGLAPCAAPGVDIAGSVPDSFVADVGRHLAVVGLSRAAGGREITSARARLAAAHTEGRWAVLVTQSSCPPTSHVCAADERRLAVAADAGADLVVVGTDGGGYRRTHAEGPREGGATAGTVVVFVSSERGRAFDLAPPSPQDGFAVDVRDPGVLELVARSGSLQARFRTGTGRADEFTRDR